MVPFPVRGVFNRFDNQTLVAHLIVQVAFTFHRFSLISSEPFGNATKLSPVGLIFAKRRGSSRGSKGLAVIPFRYQIR